MQNNQLVTQHFFYPQNLLQLGEEKLAQTVVELGSPQLGDALKIYLAIDKATQQVVLFKYRVFGNPFLIAAVSVFSEQAYTMDLSELENAEFDRVFDKLAIPATKQYVIFFIEDAVKQACKEWREKYE